MKEHYCFFFNKKQRTLYLIPNNQEATIIKLKFKTIAVHLFNALDHDVWYEKKNFISVSFAGEHA